MSLTSAPGGTPVRPFRPLTGGLGILVNGKEAVIVIDHADDTVALVLARRLQHLVCPRSSHCQYCFTEGMQMTGYVHASTIGSHSLESVAMPLLQSSLASFSSSDMPF